jgi:FkbH-like protein
MNSNSFTKDFSLSSYVDLINEAKQIRPTEGQRKLQLVVLSDFNSEQLTPLLKVFLFRNNIYADIYIPPFGAIETEVLNPSSGMYKQQPDVIIILNAVQVLRSGYYSFGMDKNNYEEYVLNKIFSIWEAIQKNCNARIIQGNFVEPIERFFGNFDSKIAWSLSSLSLSINYKIIEKLKGTPNVLLFDVNSLSSLVGRQNWFDETLWHYSKTFCSLKYLPNVASNLRDICVAAFVKTTKCLVLDLDNTLWGGTIGDDGISGIELSPEGEGAVFLEFQSYLLELKNRGIILAVASKNDHETAMQVFRKHPYMKIKEEDIAVFAINWKNKAENIQLIRDTLNISYDSMVFIDDNQFERELVGNFLPEIIIPNLPENPANYVSEISKYNLFETSSFTQEDLVRSQMYDQEVKRNELGKSFTSVDDFLKSLQMQAVVTEFVPEQLERIVQLMQRSNQFNLTTKRYSISDCSEMMKNREFLTFSVSLKDKIGDYGLISTIILKFQNDEMHIDQWLMSCRVLSRGIEQMMMNTIYQIAKSKKMKKIIGLYIPTSKNGLVKSFYEQFQFEKISENTDGCIVWEKDLQDAVTEKTYIKINVQP